MKERLIRIIFTIIGTGLLALSTALFIIPYNILTGGIAGLAIILHPILPMLTKDMIAAGSSVVLFVIGAISLGKDFSIRTILSTVVYSPLLILFSRMLKPVEVEPLLACLYGGLLGGIGVGLVLRQGGSTGGMDVPPLMMNKYFGINVAKGILVVDGLTVLLGLIEYNLGNVLLGLISVYFTNIGVEKALETGGTKGKEIKIISDKYEEIINEIHASLDRGTTLLDGSGGYTKKDRKVILCITKDEQAQKVIDIVNKYDDSAFVIVSDVTTVKGEGFTIPVRL